MKKNDLDKIMEASRRVQQIDLSKIQYSLEFQSQAFAEMITKISAIDFSPLYASIAKMSIDFSVLYKSIEKLSQLNISPLLAEITSSVFFYQSQIQQIEEILNKVAVSYALSLEKVRGNLFLSSAFIKQLREITEFQETFAIRLAESLYKTFEIDDEDEQLKKVKEIAEQTIEEQPNTKLQLEVLIFIVAIISAMFAGGQLYYAYLQYETSKQDSVETNKRFSYIMKMFEDFAQKLDDSNESEEIYYIAKRQVQIKVRPTYKSSSIQIKK